MVKQYYPATFKFKNKAQFHNSFKSFLDQA